MQKPLSVVRDEEGFDLINGKRAVYQHVAPSLDSFVLLNGHGIHFIHFPFNRIGLGLRDLVLVLVLFISFNGFNAFIGISGLNQVQIVFEVQFSKRTIALYFPLREHRSFLFYNYWLG